MVKRLIAVVLVVCMAITIGPAFAFSGTTQASSGKLASATTYTDVSPNHWASKIIQTLSSKGVINGYVDGTFKPDGKVSRAEFTKMLMVYMNISADNTPTGSFTDVPQGYWAHDYIEGAKATNLVDGYAGKVFRPSNNITRAEIAQIMTAAQAKVQKLAKYKASSVSYPFPDIAGSWALNSITTMHGLHIIDGYPDGKFRPDRTATRAEAAKMLYLLVSAVLGEKITPPATQTAGGGGDNPTPPSNPGCTSQIDSPNKGQGTFSNNGGDFTVSDPSDSGIDGARVDVPGNAVDADSNVTVAINNEKDLAGAGLGPIDTVDTRTVQASDVISISKDNCCNFKRPIQVTIPYSTSDMADSDAPSVFYWDANSKKYVAVGIVGFSRMPSTAYPMTRLVTFKTVHSGKYVALARKGLADDLGQLAVGLNTDTNFRPSEDGFTESNFGNYKTPGGSSIGMANYAAWYYMAKVAAGADTLYDLYDNDVEDQLITRSFLASSNSWNSTWQQTDNTLSPYQNGYQILQTMQITGAPQLLIMNGTPSGSEGGPTNARATLAYSYGYVNSYPVFGIYDPNFSNEDNISLRWTVSDGFSDYTKAQADSPQFDSFKFDGISSYLNPAQFETLQKGSDDGFPVSDFGRIDITSPDTDTLTDPNNVTISGTVTSGKEKANYLVYNINGLDGLDGGVVPVGSDGSFSFTIDKLPSSHNTIHLYASNQKCPTVRRCAQPYSELAELKLRVRGQSCFANLGFELGDWTGWGHDTRYLTGNDTIGRIPGDTTVTALDAINTGNGYDPIATTIPMVKYGDYSARINDQYGSSHASTAWQTINVPSSTCGMLEFSWAAVLENPTDHTSTAQPYVDISVHDDTLNMDVYKAHFYAADPVYTGWQTFTHGDLWQAIDWQKVSVNLIGHEGNQVTVKIIAADCGYGGHGGYVYIDAEE